jgi:hypothetical protein
VNENSPPPSKREKQKQKPKEKSFWFAAYERIDFLHGFCFICFHVLSAKPSSWFPFLESFAKVMNSPS